MPTTLDAEHLLRAAALRSTRPRVAVPTAVGLVRCLEPAGSVASPESRVGEDHDHVVCRSCGAIADAAVGDTSCLTASDDHGHPIGEAEVICWGLCPACSIARSP